MSLKLLYAPCKNGTEVQQSGLRYFRKAAQRRAELAAQTDAPKPRHRSTRPKRQPLNDYRRRQRKPQAPILRMEQPSRCPLCGGRSRVRLSKARRRRNREVVTLHLRRCRRCKVRWITCEHRVGGPLPSRSRAWAAAA